jgi:hypothetical protein
VSRRRGASSTLSEQSYAQIELIQEIKYVIRRPGSVTSAYGDLSEDTSLG